MSLAFQPAVETVASRRARAGTNLFGGMRIRGCKASGDKMPRTGEGTQGDRLERFGKRQVSGRASSGGQRAPPADGSKFVNGL